jgi:eukaryotic-like serine/threonine-protein kinase
VLHRDIKPGNIIVGKHGETLVVDWGLAKPLGRIEPRVDSGERTLIPRSASGSASTLPGSVLGTPAYMSPEQSEGDLEHLGPRSDVYSLGAALYCLLSGKPPFEGDLADVIRAVQKGQFRTPRQIDPSIDRALEAVCLKAMALKPADRYNSPKALAEDVERWMADEPVGAWREPRTWVLLRWLARHRVGVTAAGAALLVALAGTGAVLAVQTKANSELRCANLELATANAKVARANGALAASNEREKARFALAQEAIRTFHTGVNEDILLKQEEFKALRTRLLHEAREFYRKLEELLRGQEDRDSRMSLGRVYLEVGQLTLQLDSIEEALKVHELAVDLFEALCREDPADTEPRHMLARSLQSLSLVLRAVGRHDEGHTAAERSRALFRTLAEAQPATRRRLAQWGRSEIYYSDSLLAKGRYDEALGAIQRALAILEAPAGASPPSQDLQPELLEVYSALADVLDEGGRQEEALVAYAKARDVGEALFLASPRDPATSQVLVRTVGNLGICLRDTGRRDEALVAFDPALQVLKAAGGANPTLIMFRADSAWIDCAGAEALVALGRDAEALQALERARAARESLIKANPVVVRNHEQLLRVQRLIADIHRRAGRMSEMLTSLKHAQEFAASLAHDYPENGDLQFNLAGADKDLGGLLSAMGKTSEGLEWFGKALAIHRKMIEASPSKSSYRSSLADTLRSRGIELQRCGRPADAVCCLYAYVSAWHSFLILSGLRSVRRFETLKLPLRSGTSKIRVVPR